MQKKHLSLYFLLKILSTCKNIKGKSQNQTNNMVFKGKKIARELSLSLLAFL